MTIVRVEPRSCDQGRGKNDAFTFIGHAADKTYSNTVMQQTFHNKMLRFNELNKNDGDREWFASENAKLLVGAKPITS